MTDSVPLIFCLGGGIDLRPYCRILLACELKPDLLSPGDAEDTELEGPNTRKQAVCFHSQRWNPLPRLPRATTGTLSEVSAVQSVQSVQFSSVQFSQSVG